MVSLNDLFVEYLRRIQPSEKAIERAQNAHKPLREALEVDEQYKPYIERTLLSGSYGRHTAILNVKDVDVIILTNFTSTILREKQRSDESEQQCLLRLTQEAIKRAGLDPSTRKAQRSIHVKLPKEINNIGEDVPDLTMDIVPVMIQTNPDRDPMTIADRELSQWYDTYPLSQLADSEERNEKSKVILGRHNYKPLVKMFKAWKHIHYNRAKTPKGFILECLTAKYHNPESTERIYAVRDLWMNLCNDFPTPDLLSYIPEVPDVSNSAPRSIPIAKTVEEAQGVLKKIRFHLGLLKQAIEEEEEDLEKSATTLRRIFGQDCDELCFPLPSELDSKKHGPNPLKSSSKKNIREAPEFG